MSRVSDTMSFDHHRARALVAVAFGVGLVTSACGGGASSTATTDPAASATEEPLAASADIRLTEVLDVRTGKASSLSAAVEGDRPVLLWFWAPH